MQHIASVLPFLAVAAALSGWAKVWYDHVTSRPKVRGRIMLAMRGLAEFDERGTVVTSFTTYLYLTNSRRNALEVLDYEMSLKMSGEWHRLSRVYGLHNMTRLDFTDQNNRAIAVPNFTERLITNHPGPVEFAKPLHGWLLFAGPKELYDTVVQAYRVVCVDAFGSRHTVETSATRQVDLYLLADLAGLELPE